MPSFDTLTYAKKLQEAGFTARQAEAQAEALRGVLDDNIATRQNLKETESSLTHEMKKIEASLTHEMKEIEATLRREMKEIEATLRREMKEIEVRLTQHIELIRKDMEVMRRDIIIWLGGLIVVSIATLGILMKLL